MPAQDTSKIKEKIISIINQRGPSLPVHISNGTGISMLFASAFLSELLSEKKIITSNLRVGSSPLYFIPGQESKLENFSQYLKSKEKDAFELLKQKKFLKDSEQLPAIRVALREIKDFAIPFKKEDEIYWKYFIASEKDLQIPKKQKEEPKQETKKEVQEIEIFDKEEKEKPNIEKPVKKKIVKKKSSGKKQDDKFFNKVKEFLSEKSIEILDINSFNKNDLTLKVKINGEESLLVAYNKKRINEEDIIKANKKASELNLNYLIFSLGEPLKKLNNLLEAVKNLKSLEKIE